MKKVSYLILSEQAIATIKKIAHCKKYSLEAPLYYQGQTPIVAYFISKGNIVLVNKKKLTQKLNKGILLGHHELQFNIPSMFTAIAQKNSELWYLDKSTLLDLMKSKNFEMQKLYLELTK